MNAIYNMDCIQGMKSLPSDIVDLTITSPPYNLGVDYNKYKDMLTLDEYKEQVYSMCEELYRLSKDGGRVCINIPIITKDWGNQQERVSADQIFQNCLDKVGFTFREKIIWNKRGVSKRNAWGSYMKPSCPWITYPIDVILVYVKGTQKLPVKHKDLITISKEEFIRCSYGLWRINKSVVKCSKTKAKGGDKLKHPATFPKAIPQRLINFYSYKGAVVLDPYMGIGTTCIAAKELEREYIGFEIDEKYYSYAKKALEE
nr:site-specific DNA-methyltransferase [uncultured Niameybacter sp.]